MTAEQPTAPGTAGQPVSGPPATDQPAREEAVTGQAGSSQSAPPARRPEQPRSLGQRAWHRLSVANETWTLLALVILMVFFTIREPGKFFTLDDFSLIAQNSAAYLVMAVGQTFVILTAGIDLSVGSVLVLAGVVADLYCIHHGGANAGWGAIAIGSVLGMLTGAGCGALQGFLIAKAKIPPLIATLAGFGALSGVAYLITGGADFRTVPDHLVNTVGLGSSPP